MIKRFQSQFAERKMCVIRRTKEQRSAGFAKLNSLFFSRFFVDFSALCNFFFENLYKDGKV